MVKKLSKKNKQGFQLYDGSQKPQVKVSQSIPIDGLTDGGPKFQYTIPVNQNTKKDFGSKQKGKKDDL